MNLAAKGEHRSHLTRSCLPFWSFLGTSILPRGAVASARTILMEASWPWDRTGSHFQMAAVSLFPVGGCYKELCSKQPFKS